MSLTFTEAQVVAGVELIQAWYEGARVEQIDPKEFIGACNVAAKTTKPTTESSTDWTGCCC